uniref:Uncharacterized protein n=1 Tax=Oryza glaberrima TaxID=4538 RepID=I1R694_ORYGL
FRTRHLRRRAEKPEILDLQTLVPQLLLLVHPQVGDIGNIKRSQLGATVQYTQDDGLGEGVTKQGLEMDAGFHGRLKEMREIVAWTRNVVEAAFEHKLKLLEHGELLYHIGEHLT